MSDDLTYVQCFAKIKSGYRTENGGLKEYPGHFVIGALDENDPRTASRIQSLALEFFGDKPAEFHFRLPFATPAENFRLVNEIRDAKGVLRKCDGTTIFVDFGGVTPRPCEREGSGCKCKNSGTLYLDLPEFRQAARRLGLYGYVLLNTHSFNGCRAIGGMLESIYADFGTLLNVPMILYRTRKSMTVTIEGKRSQAQKWTPAVILDIEQLDRDKAAAPESLPITVQAPALETGIQSAATPPPPDPDPLPPQPPPRKFTGTWRDDITTFTNWTDVADLPANFSKEEIVNVLIDNGTVFHTRQIIIDRYEEGGSITLRFGELYKHTETDSTLFREAGVIEKSWLQKSGVYDLPRDLMFIFDKDENGNICIVDLWLRGSGHTFLTDDNTPNEPDYPPQPDL